MKEELFVEKYQPTWLELESIFEQKTLEEDKLLEVPEMYRQLCNQLGLAKQRKYSSQVTDRLNRLATRGHHFLYENKRISRSRWLEFLTYGFPRALRQNLAYVVIATLLFFGPLLTMGLLVYTDSELVYSMMSSGQVRSFESMYDPDNEALGRDRDAGDDLTMFGYYIKNNIGIGLTTFASGILFGIGAIFILVYNGLVIGSVAGYLTQAGYVETFYSFVAGHSSFELLAIVFCGAAGLRLGFALVSPGSWRRGDALKFAAKDAVQIVYGAALMLLIAAFIEAFWSSAAAIPVAVKYTVGLSLWGVLLAYFFFAGRGRRGGS